LKCLGTSASGRIGGLLGLSGASPGGILSGGLGELVERFKESGQGETAASWVGTGPNKPVTPSQLEQAIGPEALDTLSKLTGLSRDDLLARLSRALPEPSIDTRRKVGSRRNPPREFSARFRSDRVDCRHGNAMIVLATRHTARVTSTTVLVAHDNSAGPNVRACCRDHGVERLLRMGSAEAQQRYIFRIRVRELHGTWIRRYLAGRRQPPPWADYGTQWPAAEVGRGDLRGYADGGATIRATSKG
jgi:YidB-like protein